MILWHSGFTDSGLRKAIENFGISVCSCFSLMYHYKINWCLMIKNSNYNFFLIRSSGCRRVLLCIILLLIASVSGQITQSSLSDSINALLTARGYKDKTAGIIIKDLSNDSILAGINADRRFNPASVSKLITASAGISLLGNGYRFMTLVYADGPFSRDSGILHGDLIIRGGGDPGFTAERLWLLVRHLSNAGIKEISRDLVLDDGFFDDVMTGPGFNEDNSSRAYEAPAAALSASFNTVAVNVLPGSAPGSPAQVHILPGIAGMKIINTAVTAGAGKPAAIQARTEKVNGRTALYVSGSIGADAQSKYTYCKIWETWENFGGAIQELFNETGIRFSGKVRHGAVPDSVFGAAPFYMQESQPLFETIKPMFKVSSNFAAEMLFKTIAAEKAGAPGSWTAGSRIVEKWWVDSGYPGVITVQNGSGMGNGNRISPAQIAFLLQKVWNNKIIMPDFLSALPAAGVDGTLEKRFAGSHLTGKVRAKTGTLNNYGVSSLAGYVLLDNRTCVFAILFNGAGADQFRHWETQQKILEMAFPKSAASDSLKIQRKGLR
jgi:D-alanyl-D-alanine carboxypeptidase/D-alanyl-D-alanine-endopeptidase (penicillin-binding protein 4)